MVGEPNVSNEVVMEAIRLKDMLKLASPDEIREGDIHANLELVDKEEPDEIMFVPPYHSWCLWHRVLSALKPGQGWRLAAKEGATSHWSN